MRLLQCLLLLSTSLLFSCSHEPAPKSVLNELAKPPVQRDLKENFTISLPDGDIIKRAHYQITARVFDTEYYYFDESADIMPFDMALAWSSLGEDKNFKQLHVSQSRRWYIWRADTKFLPLKEIAQSSSNHHIIPASAKVRDILKSADSGDIVRMSGFLVDVILPNGVKINTSRRRDDVGAGACEVMFVTTAEVYNYN